MRTRIQVAVIGIPALLAIIFLLPPWVFGILLGAACALCSMEFSKATKVVFSTRTTVYCAISAFSIPLLFSLPFHLSSGLFVALLLLLALFAEAFLVFDTSKERPFSELCMLFFAGAVIPLLLGSLAILRAIPTGQLHGDSGVFFDGRVYVMIPVIIAFISDAGGYFAGHAFGKRKLIEKISPKKTIEGSLGGFAAAFLGMLAFCLVMILVFGAQYSLLLVLVYSIFGSAVTQVGDLAFSLIKREYDIKDFSDLIPGHGGMLDRLDSLVFLAPFITALVFWFPVFLQ